jgi:protein SCO1
MNTKVFVLICLTFIFACKDEVKKLPILGDPIETEGKLSYPKIHNFSFTNQENKNVNSSTFSNKIYVADFIFLHCSTICPLMHMEMLKVYHAFENDDRVLFLSHTIDPENDSIPQLKIFADNLGVNANKWHFVTGNKDSIYAMAQRDYFTTAYPDSAETDGLVHGGGLLLIDKNKNIRGVYNGTDAAETERLIADISILLKEQF